VSIGLGRLWEWACLRTIRNWPQKSITQQKQTLKVDALTHRRGSGELRLAVGSAEVSEVLCMNIDVRTEPCPWMY